MDLINEINRNDKNKNAIKLAKENINAEIISGGGTIANTLNDVPRCINEMIKENYKKIAIGTGVITRPKGSGRPIMEFNLENTIEFNPSRFILNLTEVVYVNASMSARKWCIADSKFPEGRVSVSITGGNLDLKIDSIDGKKIKIMDRGSSESYELDLRFDYLAIE